MGRIFFNEDPNHFVISRKMAGYEKITMEDARNFILQYKDTQITDFFVCLGASGAWYDSENNDNIIQNYKRWEREGKTDDSENNFVVSSVRLVKDFFEDYGTSVQAVFVDTLREIGINPWISIRMNDIHEAGEKESILHSDFFRHHRDLNRVSHREPAGYYDYALDYMFSEVREHYLGVLKDALGHFDAYGIELDFMREIYSIGIGREYEGVAVINAFMREAYALVKEAEAHWGHSVKVAVRLPDTPEKALRLGFDFFDWVDAGIVDCLVVTPRWASTDNHMPIDLWKKILKGKDVVLAAGQEILIRPYNRRGVTPQYNTYETAIATACAHHFQGADAIYLFNYMDGVDRADNGVTDDGRDLSLCMNRDLYRKFLCTAGDYDLSAAAHRRHLVTYSDVDAIGVTSRKQLPVRLAGKREHPTGFSALRIATGKILPSQKVSVILGFSGDEYQKEDIRVFLNAKPCRLVCEQAPLAQQFDDMRYYRFEAENDGDLVPVAVIEVGLCEGRAEVHWAEIEISETQIEGSETELEQSSITEQTYSETFSTPLFPSQSDEISNISAETVSEKKLSGCKKALSTNPFNLKSALTFEKNICRAIAAWILCVLATLLTTEGNFFDLSFAQDESFGGMLLSLALTFCCLTVIAAFLSKYETDSWFLLLGVTGCVIHWLSKYKNDIISDVKIGESIMKMNSDETLFLLAVIFVYALFLFYFLQKNDLLLDKLKLHSGVTVAIVAVLGVASATVIAVTTSMRYLSFASPNFDFGLFVNMFHNMAETGLPLVSSERDVLLSHFVIHISPICYLLLPIYVIFPSALTLQIAQAVLVASGIIPAILLTRHFKLSNLTQVAVAIIYAAYPIAARGCFFDFHENCFLLPLLLWMFYFFEKEKYPWMYIFAILTLAVKEDTAVYVIFFALFLIVSRRKYLHGIVLALGAAVYFIVALAILEGSATYWAEFYASDTPNPSIKGPMINRFDNLIYEEGGGLWGAIFTALKNPGYLLTQFFSTNNAHLDSFFIERSPWAKVVYLIQLLLPLGMIPFVTKKQSRWLLMAPILLNVLAAYKYQYSINFHYHFGVSAFVIYAMILNLPEIQPIPRRRLLALGAAASCCLYMVIVLPKFDYYTNLWKNNQERYQAIDEMLDDLPEDASLCVPGAYLSHVADRREVYEHSYHVLSGDKNQLKEYDVDYAVIRIKDDDKYRVAFQARGYTVWAEYDGHIILKSPHVD